MSGQQTRPASHVPVLPRQVLDALAPQPGQVVVDATVGGGGHARFLAERIVPGGRLIGLDRDPAMLELARSKLHHLPVTLVQRNFDDLPNLLQELHVDQVDAVLADLGFCSDQIDDPERGLSFQKEGPLDMRLDRSEGMSARRILEQLSERDLADLFWKYGEERFSRRIARRIVAERRRSPLETTSQLAELVRRCVPRPRVGRISNPSRGRGARINPATRVFQALRIAVNDELGSLERFLERVPICLKPGGKVAVISFHSLEDRLVKQAFRNRDIFQELFKKPIRPTAEEIRTNPRARSAKLRAARRTLLAFRAR